MVKRLSSDPAARRGPSPKPVALRVELLDIEPLIWRRIMVSNQSTLASLQSSASPEPSSIDTTWAMTGRIES
jgi:hypothetical protein